MRKRLPQTTHFFQNQKRTSGSLKNSLTLYSYPPLEYVCGVLHGKWVLSGDEVLWNAFGETGGGLQQFCARWKHVDRSNAEADSDARASIGTNAARKEAGVQSALKSARERATLERARFGLGIAELIPTLSPVRDTPVLVEAKVLPETADPVALKGSVGTGQGGAVHLMRGRDVTDQLQGTYR